MPARLGVVLFVAAAAALAAQGAQTTQDPQPTFRAGANYVRVDMYAMQDGEPVHDLRPEEIELLEDGVRQTIEDFEHVLVRAAAVQEAGREPDGLAASREAAGDPRARVFVIFLDTYHTQAAGSARVRQALVGFLDRVLGPDDLVALMTPEMGGSDIALGRKTTVIANILDQEWWGRRARLADEDEREMLYSICGARLDRGQIVAEMIARRREKLTLDALDDLMVHLAGLRDERKAVVVVSEGWLLYEPDPRLAAPNPQVGPAPPPVLQPPVPPPAERGIMNPSAQIECEAEWLALSLVDHQRRLRQITEDANRGNVTFYPVYPLGLTVFDAPIGPDPPPPLPVDAANLRTRHNTLRVLAWDTDGEAIINTNDTEGGLKRIADDLSSYYLLGYYSTNTSLDGRFRSITVRVARPGVRVRARRGYRGRTAEDLVSSTAVADPARGAVDAALNAVAGLNARSSFRVRPSAWSRANGGEVAGAVWLVGELDYRTRRELAWTAGADADVVVLGADGSPLVSTTVRIPAGEGSFDLRVPENGALAPGDYAVRVRLRSQAGGESLSDTVRVVVSPDATTLGEAVIWRRGPSTGPQYLRTADPRFQRNERLRLELATSAEGDAAARMLDRTGQPLQVPVQVTERADPATGVRWVVADATLAPLAAGDYAVEVTLGEATQVTGFRVVP